jgi:hypothetical protein
MLHTIDESGRQNGGGPSSEPRLRVHLDDLLLRARLRAVDVGVRRRHDRGELADVELPVVVRVRRLEGLAVALDVAVEHVLPLPGPETGVFSV